MSLIYHTLSVFLFGIFVSLVSVDEMKNVHAGSYESYLHSMICTARTSEAKISIIIEESFLIIIRRGLLSYYNDINISLTNIFASFVALSAVQFSLMLP